MIINLDCLLGMRTCLADNSIDAVVTDPPYGLSKEPDMMEVMKHWMNGDDYVHTGGGFMGKSWDSFVPGPSIWKEVFRVLKPGGHLLAFFGSRTYDMGTLAIRLAGFEIRDQIMWVYGSGFPKSLDVSKAIDKAAGVKFDAIPASGVGFMNAEGEGGYNVTKNQLIVPVNPPTKRNSGQAGVQHSNRHMNRSVLPANRYPAPWLKTY